MFNLGAGAEEMFGPFPRAGFGEENGLVQVTYAAVTQVTIGVSPDSTGSRNSVCSNECTLS